MKTICFALTATLFICYASSQEQFENSQFPNNDGYRVKRQQEPDPADQFFDSVFQIPISTLNAVNGLIKSTRPVIRRARERIQQQYQSWQEQANNGGRPNRGKPNGRPRPAGREEELE